MEPSKWAFSVMAPALWKNTALEICTAPTLYVFLQFVKDMVFLSVLGLAARMMVQPLRVFGFCLSVSYILFLCYMLFAAQSCSGIGWPHILNNK